MKLIQQGFSWCCAGALLLNGCAATPPKTVEISGAAQQQEVKGKLSRFLGQSCVNAIDSDVQLSWRAYGQGKMFSATMQAMAPSSLRLALVDPLGRPLILLGAHENGFTLADNNEAIGYTGGMDLDVVHKFLPEFIPTGDLFYWLSGRVSRTGMRVVSTRMDADADAEESLHWYEITYNNRRDTATDGMTRMTHMLALNEENQLIRHMVLDADNDIQFEAKYSNYSSTPRTCAWPGKVVISGEALEADFSLEFTKIFNYKPIDRKRFHVRLPPHFTVRKIINS